MKDFQIITIYKFLYFALWTLPFSLYFDPWLPNESDSFAFAVIAVFLMAFLLIRFQNKHNAVIGKSLNVPFLFISTWISCIVFIVLLWQFHQNGIGPGAYGCLLILLALTFLFIDTVLVKITPWRKWQDNR